MIKNNFRVYLSQYEEERFGFRTARAECVTLASLPETMSFCSENDVEFLIARCDVSDITTVHEMERQGFLLMDTLVYMSLFVDKQIIPDYNEDIEVRSVQSGDEKIIAELAKNAFRGYFGHYHADDRLENHKCDEAYESWALRSCTYELADDVVVALLNRKIAGFCSVKRIEEDVVEWRLGCVSPSSQSKGVVGALAAGVLRWSKERGAKFLLTSGLLNNIPVLKTYVNVGFTHAYSFYTFHKWFDE